MEDLPGVQMTWITDSPARMRGRAVESKSLRQLPRGGEMPESPFSVGASGGDLVRSFDGQTHPPRTRLRCKPLCRDAAFFAIIQAATISITESCIGAMS
ncbi:MAG: hypothetical protein R6X17_12420 [Candidatus Competibacteraceae bacterium]|jgi:hypothetical protein